MTAQRTDPHRPGVIVPTDYEAVLWYALPDPSIPGDRGDGMQELAEESKRSRAEGRRSFGSGGVCGVCGAIFRYGQLWVHTPTKDLVHLGHDCAAKYELLASRPEWIAKLESLKARRAAYMTGIRNAKKRETFLAKHPGLKEALAGDHRILRDLADKLHHYQYLSEKQIAFALKLGKEVAGKTETRAVEVLVPAPIVEGRQTIEGRVLSLKEHESDFGVVTKMTVKIETPKGNWLTWGTKPGGLAIERGDVVRFDAKLKAGRDAHFAIYSRPTKAEVVKKVEDTPESPKNNPRQLPLLGELGTP